MKVINKIVDLQNELFDRRKEGKEIGASCQLWVRFMRVMPLW